MDHELHEADKTLGNRLTAVFGGGRPTSYGAETPSTAGAFPLEVE